jgi:hypothetical protein
MSVSNQAITNNTYQGSHDSAWATLYALVDFPQVYPKLVQRYGRGFSRDFFEFLTIAGQVGTCKAQTITTFEKGSPEKAVTLSAAITEVGAGENITVKINEWNGAGQAYLKEGDKILIPPAYITKSSVKPVVGHWYQVVTRGTVQATESETAFTCTPLDALSVLAVEVPIATKLMVTGGNYAPGSEGAKPRNSGWYSRTFTTAIKRAAFAIEGSQQSTERYVDHLVGGIDGVFSEASIQGEFDLDQSINYEILLGGVANNLTMNNEDSVANSVRGTLGLLPQLEARACRQYYTSTYDVPELDNIKKAWISQGVTETEGSFMAGNDLLLGMENNCAAYIKEFSGGTDLMTKLNELHVGFKVITKGLVKITLHELKSFSNPNTLANYDLGRYGFILPNTQVTVREGEGATEVKIPNVQLAYKNYNGENRQRMFGMITGINGMGYGNGQIADERDRIKGHWESEFMLQVHAANQMLLVLPSSVL